MEPTPIHDAIRRERALESMRKAGEAMGHIANLMNSFREGFMEGRKAASNERSPSLGSSTPEVSAGSASRHSLQDSSRPEGSSRGRGDWMVERDWSGAVIGQYYLCSCDGCAVCKGHERDCTCDVDWDAMAERRLDNGQG